jgi:SWI/SNF-related matrix-associated actin-dependent regulator of chromatin subfamily A3
MLTELGRFEHLITGLITATPPLETGGGILADEMGMGKSLAMLSHIAKTLARSHIWAQSGHVRDDDLLHETLSSRSTLIVVPSMRKSALTCLGC